jgi:hypothetical protein
VVLTVALVLLGLLIFFGWLHVSVQRALGECVLGHDWEPAADDSDFRYRCRDCSARRR